MYGMPMAPHLMRQGDVLVYLREVVEEVSGPIVDPETGGTERVITCASGRTVTKKEGDVCWVQRSPKPPRP